MNSYDICLTPLPLFSLSLSLSTMCVYAYYLVSMSSTNIASYLHGVAPLKEGSLQKSASSKGVDEFRVGTWSERHFKLMGIRSTGGERLDYYKRVNDSEPAGSIDLRDARIAPVDADSAGGRPHCIRVSAAAQIFTYLACASAEEAHEWLRALRKAAGVDENELDTLAEVAALDLTEHTAHLCGWTVLLQDVPLDSKAAHMAITEGGNNGTDEDQLPLPDLVTIVFAADGSVRLYKEGKLWRIYPAYKDGKGKGSIESAVLGVESSGSASFGVGVGKKWRMLVQVKLLLRHPIVPNSASGRASTVGRPDTARFNLYVSSEAEAASLLHVIRSLRRNDLSLVKAWTDRKPTLQGVVEIFDESFRTQWTNKFAMLTDQHLIIFRNSNDSSPWRCLFTGCPIGNPGALEVKTEGRLGLVIAWVLERDPITLKFGTEHIRDDWNEGLAVFTNAATQKALLDMAEKERLDAESNKPKARVYKPLTLADTAEAASAPASNTNLQDDDGAPPPPPADALHVFEFSYPALESLGAGEPGYVLALGAGGSGQLAQRNKGDSVRPLLIESVKGKLARGVSAGATHAGLLTDQGHVYMFGAGAPGTLGLGERMVESKLPALLTSLLQTHIRALTCGARHTLALSDKGIIFAWGANDAGQCGVGHKNPLLYPTLVPAFSAGVPVISISAGASHSGAVSGLPKLELYTWGGGTNGCLGLGSTDTQLSPVRNSALRKAGMHVARVACGSDFTLAVMSTGALFSCGVNTEGQLGHGDRLTRSVFAEVRALKERGVKVFQAVAGAAHAAVLGVTAAAPDVSAVYSFGAGIANGFREAQLVPVHVQALQSIRSLSSSSAAAHTLAVSGNQRAFAYGVNKAGELGNGEAGVQALVKVRLNTAIHVVDVAAGNSFSLLLCRGTPPDYLLPGSASEVAPPPPPAENIHMKQQLGLFGNSAGDAAASPFNSLYAPSSNSASSSSGSSAGGGIDMASAMESITRLLRMEASLGDASASQKQTTHVQAGTIDIMKMHSIGNMEGDVITKPPVASEIIQQQQQQPSTSSARVPLAGSGSPEAIAAAQARVAQLGISSTLKRVSAITASAQSAPFVYKSPTAPVAGSGAATSTNSSASVPNKVNTGASSSVAAAIAAANARNVTMNTVNSPLSPFGGSASGAAAVSSAEKKSKLPLPPGWKKVKDESSGRSYYYHQETKETSWKRPKPIEENEMPPPPPPPAEDMPPPPPAPDSDDDMPPPPPTA
jgi:alpha-tubulin suppressor-like RCC1 family protein